MIGLQGKDKCEVKVKTTLYKYDHDKEQVAAISGYNIVFGIDTVFLGVVIVLGVVVAYLYLDSKQLYTRCNVCYQILVGHLVVFITLLVLFCIAAFIYSFFVNKPLYRDYKSWKKESINCTSPTLYIGFAFLTILYSVLGLIILIVIGFIVFLFLIPVVFPPETW